GKGRQGDIEFLKELGEAIKDSSQCGLGQTLPNPVLSTLEHFKDEYNAHIKEKKCPAGVCKPLITFSIDKKKCTGCDLCRIECSVEAITGEKNKLHTIDKKKCIKCGVCYDVCMFDAVIKK
ncbi:MAG: 4Fe-4S dicluster domain-containing protein, partial [Candidatus Cloacimonadota bacterium]